MSILTDAFIGAVVNRIRGGLLVILGNKFKLKQSIINIIDKCDKNFNDLVFALLFGLLTPSYMPVAILFFSMWIGRVLGWGRYIGGLIRRDIDPNDKPEIAIIDSWLLKTTDSPMLKNTVALSLRGLLWSFMLAVGLYLSYFDPRYLLFIPFGLLMGVVYLASIELCGFFGKREAGWGVGEYAFGFVLWGGVSLIIKSLTI